jgi:hypothetical protein
MYNNINFFRRTPLPFRSYSISFRSRRCCAHPSPFQNEATRSRSEKSANLFIKLRVTPTTSSSRSTQATFRISHTLLACIYYTHGILAEILRVRVNVVTFVFFFFCFYQTLQIHFLSFLFNFDGYTYATLSIMQ